MSRTIMLKKADIISIEPIWVESRAGFQFECISSIQDIDSYIMRDARLVNSVSRIYLSETCADVMQKTKSKLIAQDDFISLLLEKYVYFAHEEPCAYYSTLREFILSRSSPDRRAGAFAAQLSRARLRAESGTYF